MASGYDISVSASDSTTQTSRFGEGTWTVGGNSAMKWVHLALVVLGGFALWVWFKNKK